MSVSCTECLTNYDKVHVSSLIWWCTCLTWDDNTGVSALSFHRFIRRVSHREDVWRPLVDLAALVLVHISLVVDIDCLVRVDRHHHLSNVCVDLVLWVSKHQQQNQYSMHQVQINCSIWIISCFHSCYKTYIVMKALKVIYVCCSAYIFRDIQSLLTLQSLSLQKYNMYKTKKCFLILFSNSLFVYESHVV